MLIPCTMHMIPVHLYTSCTDVSSEHRPKQIVSFSLEFSFFFDSVFFLCASGPNVNRPISIHFRSISARDTHTHTQCFAINSYSWLHMGDIRCEQFNTRMILDMNRPICLQFAVFSFTFPPRSKLIAVFINKSPIDDENRLLLASGRLGSDGWDEYYRYDRRSFRNDTESVLLVS